MLLFPDEITHGRESHLSDKNRVTYSNIAIMHGGLVRSPPLLGTSETGTGGGGCKGYIPSCPTVSDS